MDLQTSSMDVRTYRAATMYEALAMVRRDLGPDAAVLHTREVPARGWWGWLRGARQIEVTASAGVNVPSRLPQAACGPVDRTDTTVASGLSVRRAPANHTMAVGAAAAPWEDQLASGLSDEVRGRLNELQAMVRELCRQTRQGGPRDLPETLFRLFTDLIEADLDEELARELIERVRTDASDTELADPVLLRARIARLIESELVTLGPIPITPGRRRLVAMVGPTGVGKTTTIAKLAAIYRLKQKRSVGLITVDTYRIAAVEQLRTYADIIDLPMQVVSTPREMRDAVRRMNALDLILLDTAGRSPKDGIKIQELRAFLTEAGADEVYLVLSAVGAAKTLVQTAERFAPVGTTGLVFTKLDEATSLGGLLPVIRHSRLPLAYLTNGQNVPEDIEVAEPARVARLILGLESVSRG